MFIAKPQSRDKSPLLLFFAFILAVTGANAQGSLSASQLSDSFAEVARRIEPAVVSIDAKAKAGEAVRGAPPNSGDEILDFLRRQSRRPATSVGSGFIVDRSGHILTNAHVIQDSTRITVRLENGQEYVAEVLGIDEETDIAVLKIDAGRDLPVARLGDSSAARVGEWVLAIGSPFGLARTVTAGIVSQTNRDTPTTSVFQRFIQTDAAINRGNSGGPLVNMSGDVIGVNSQIATSTGDYNGVGFALPSNEAKYVYEQILKNGRVKRGFLGVALESVKPEFATVFGLPDAKGAIVTDVRPRTGGAAKVGLAAGDVITKFNGSPVSSAQDLIARVAGTAPEQAVTLEYLRESGSTFEKRSTEVVLGERPIATRADEIESRPMPIAKDEDTKPLGLTVGELTPTLAATYRLQGQKGVLVREVNPDSFVADIKSANGVTAALGAGDLIQRVNRVSVSDTKAFSELVGRLKKGDPVVLHVLTYSPSEAKPILKVVQFTVQ